jgi:tripartite-type tricarboxylate transporter receptor subunit TctC
MRIAGILQCMGGLAAACFIAAAAFAQTPATAPAQAFPSRTVRINVPFSAGSGPDVFVRVLAERLSKLWGRQVLVDARPGGNGFIAIEAVKKAPPDGHELLIVANSHMAINPNLMKKLPYDPEKDFVPVALLFRNSFFITVASDSPYQSVPALIAAAKANPGKLSYGTPYVGSPPHLGSALFEYLTGTKMIHVPFKDTTQIFISVANGDVSWAFGSVGSTAPIVKTGKLKLIAIGAKSRLPTHPDIPTIEEAGGPPGVLVDAWTGLIAPRGTPEAVVRRINGDIVRQLGEADILERLRILGFEAAPVTPEAFGEIIRSDIKRMGEIIRRVGVTAD